MNGKQITSFYQDVIVKIPNFVILTMAIVTGDLRIIKNKKLRSLLLKGPGFRERQSVNWKRFITEFKASLDECVKKWAST